MSHRSAKFIFFVLAVCFFVTNATAQSYESIKDFEREITLRLLKKDVGVFANELAKEPANNTQELLRRLIIYSRAGHEARLKQIIKQYLSAPDLFLTNESMEIIKEVIFKDDYNDTEVLRLYFERIRHVEGNVNKLLQLWEKVKSDKEIDAWLVSQAERFDDKTFDYFSRHDWFSIRFEWRRKRGTVEPLLNEIENDARNNSKDMFRVLRYLHLANLAGVKPFFSIEDLEFTTAYENYAFGSSLSITARNGQAMDVREGSLRVAINFLDRSLSLPFTEHDKKMMLERAFRFASQPPQIANWEKQLRYWTKKSLFECYRSLNQPMPAQKLAEELVEMERDGDIQAYGGYFLAGNAQSSSGMRVIEQKILNEEKERKDTARYWIERANYYKGRGEENQVLETYRQALANLPYTLQNKDISQERLSVLYAYAEYAEDKFDNGNYGNEPDKEWSELEQLLRREFYATVNDANYSYGLIRAIYRGEFEELLNEIFITQKDLFFRLFAPRHDWENNDFHLIKDVFESVKISFQRKEEMWQQLIAAVKNSSVRRKYDLAEIMIDSGGASHAILLLQNCLKQLGDKDDDDAGVYRSNVKETLFEAYCESGDWRAAEKMFYANKDEWWWEYLYLKLEKLAVSAAKAGDVKDAVRLWSIRTNLNRRWLYELNELANTKAKNALREFYLQMKKNDPNTTAPDAALQILK
jgi:hypothetical protein